MAERPSNEWIEAANCLATVSHQLSSVLHEANNFLQVIAGSAEMIQMQAGLPESVERRTAVIAEHAQKVSALLGTVRELAKVAPSTPGDRVDLGAAIATALELRRHGLTRWRIATTVDVPFQAPVARVSWRVAMQVLLNLLLNAERSVRGRADARIALQVVRDDASLVLSVSDNGAGQALPATTAFTVGREPDVAPRLGLGLEAVRALANGCGGALDVQVREDGAVVAVTLPAA